jgi:hypothetical protein
MEDLSASEKLLPGDSQARSEPYETISSILRHKQRWFEYCMTFPILLISLILNIRLVVYGLYPYDVDRATVQHSQRYCESQCSYHVTGTNSSQGLPSLIL